MESKKNPFERILLHDVDSGSIIPAIIEHVYQDEEITETQLHTSSVVIDVDENGNLVDLLTVNKDSEILSFQIAPESTEGQESSKGLHLHGFFPKAAFEYRKQQVQKQSCLSKAYADILEEFFSRNLTIRNLLEEAQSAELFSLRDSPDSTTSPLPLPLVNQQDDPVSLPSHYLHRIRRLALSNDGDISPLDDFPSPSNSPPNNTHPPSTATTGRQLLKNSGGFLAVPHVGPFDESDTFLLPHSPAIHGTHTPLLNAHTVGLTGSPAFGLPSTARVFGQANKLGNPLVSPYKGEPNLLSTGGGNSLNNSKKGIKKALFVGENENSRASSPNQEVTDAPTTRISIHTINNMHLHHRSET